MNAPALSFPSPRVAPHLAHAFGGVWRLTFRRFLLPGHWLAVGIGLAFLTLLFAGGPRGGTPETFLTWTTQFYIAFLVPALAFVSGAGAMRDELKSNSVDYTLTRPVPRAALVLFKYLAHTVCLQAELLLALVVALGFAVAHNVPDLSAVAAKLFLGQFLLVAAFSALGFFCAALTSRYIVLGLAYAGVIEAGLGQIPTQLSRLSMTNQVRDLLTTLLAAGEPPASVPGIPGTAGMVLLFSAVALAAAMALFTHREFGGAGDA
jgi:ABC-2 type transport system permease protein